MIKEGLSILNISLKRVISFVCSIILFCTGYSQVKNETAIDNSFLIYREQLKGLYRSRGMQSEEIEQILKSFSSYNLTSNYELATALKTLYPDDAGIAVIFYFFNSDTLHRTLFEPGKIKSTAKRPINKDELGNLSKDLNTALRLKSLSSDRAPKLRGANPEQEETGISIDQAIANATEVLMPDHLDTQYKHLIIIPALNIGTIPFHLLKPYSDNLYLVERCSYTIAPTVLDLIALRTRILKQVVPEIAELLTAKRSFSSLNIEEEAYFSLESPLFISNPAYPENTAYDFPDLPGAAKEIDSVRKYAKQYVLLKGQEAIKDSITRLMDGRDLVYFATHAIADEEDPMNKSFLVLSGKDPFLTTKELQDLRLRKGFKFPEMVILSACQTGLGKSMEAGVAGLARPFLIGGSNNVVMSLWSVDDESTAYLMTRFIHYLQEPQKHMPSQQLRKAVLDTKKLYPNPIYWAAFSVFGIDY